MVGIIELAGLGVVALPHLVDFARAGPTGGSVADLAARSNGNSCSNHGNGNGKGNGKSKKPNFVYIIADE